jgi:hypothetical protein
MNPVSPRRFRRYGIGGALVAAALGAQMTVALAGAGTWTIVASPSPPASLATLASVSCPDSGACFAVGNAFTHGKDRPLVERWDGTAWSVVPTPALSLLGSLGSVSCVSSRSCMAVGSSFGTTGGLARTFTARWDGASWSQIASPTPGQGGSLTGVWCVNDSRCDAVGESISGSGTQRALVERWNGTTWSVIASPNASGVGSWLSSVSCSTASNCFAVGEREPSQQTGRTLVERWTGAAWTIVPSPNVSSSSVSRLIGVACTGPNACAAVGWYLGAQGSTTLTETWGGASWRIVPSANVTGNGSLDSVSCASPNDCVAAGGYSRGTGVNATLIERWQGTAWTAVGHPNPTPSKGSGLFGIDCRVPAACVAVGDNAPTVSDETTLVEQRQ